METKKAFVRRPSARLAEGLVTHIERRPVDLDLAQNQWQAYVDALRSAGWQTIEVAPAPDCPDSAFIEDTMVVYGSVAVIARPGAVERQPETAAAEEAARGVGYQIKHIVAPGTLDGGDVLKHGGTVWVGQGGRTNAEGIRQLREHLVPLGADVIAVPLSKVLHLKSAVTALPDGTIIGYQPLVDDVEFWGDAFLGMPEEPGAHVVILDPNTVLMSSSGPESIRQIQARGLNVVQVDISEFEKLEGCVTCLSVRLRGL
ncbi:MAG: N(G),N(G)-dimethylarginine dimethylaminohydrolase [Acidobacteriota bacterium]|nr:N(G),N(G)-dimethylarginine dimethylaminohydrolase [Acidobacteriota bacterium]